jgi:hypothetical protein
MCRYKFSDARTAILGTSTGREKKQLEGYLGSEAFQSCNELLKG